jgi:hypothetical protein
MKLLAMSIIVTERLTVMLFIIFKNNERNIKAI